MRRFLVCLALLVGFVTPVAAATVEQNSGRKTTEDAASSAGSFSVTPTVGRHVIVMVAVWHASTAGCSSITDNQSNTYTEHVDARGEGASTAAVCIYSAKITTSSGTFTVTVNGSANSYWEWAMLEVSGLDGTTWFDKAGSNTGTTTGDGNATASAPNSQDNMFVVAAMAITGTDALAFGTPATGYTEIAVQNNGSATVGHQSAYKSVSAAETSSVTFDHSQTDQQFWAAGVATFIATGGAAASPRRLLLLGIGGDE